MWEFRQWSDLVFGSRDVSICLYASQSITGPHRQTWRVTKRTHNHSWRDVYQSTKFQCFCSVRGSMSRKPTEIQSGRTCKLHKGFKPERIVLCGHCSVLDLDSLSVCASYYTNLALLWTTSILWASGRMLAALNSVQSNAVAYLTKIRSFVLSHLGNTVSGESTVLLF